jgi:hypothetical protein
LIGDIYLFNNRSRVWGILNIPNEDVVEAEYRWRNEGFNNYGLFTNMINAWKSKTNGTPRDLCRILRADGFELSARKQDSF